MDILKVSEKFSMSQTVLRSSKTPKSTIKSPKMNLTFLIELL